MSIGVFGAKEKELLLLTMRDGTLVAGSRANGASDEVPFVRLSECELRAFAPGRRPQRRDALQSSGSTPWRTSRKI